MTSQMRAALIGLTRTLGTARISYLGTQHQRAAEAAWLWRQEQSARKARSVKICPDCGMPEAFHNGDIASVLNAAIHSMLVVPHLPKPENLN